MFALLRAIEPRAIDWELVKEGNLLIPKLFSLLLKGNSLSEEDIQLNAKYAISVARKLGATVFCVWEDIRDVKPKMIMTFVGALAQLEKQGKDHRTAMLEFNAKEGTATA